MARTFGKFTTSIYDSDEFRALTFEQQGVYYMLGLQGEISAAGVLPLRLKRWTRNASGATTGDLAAALDDLAQLGHVVYDEETEELLLVKFVKWDKGYANEKRRPVLAEAAREIASETLRGVLAEELRSIAADHSGNPSDAVSQWLSDTASAIAPDTTTRFDRSVVTEGESDTPSHNPQAASPAPVAAATTRALAVVEPPTAQTIVGEWIERAPKRPPGQVVGQVAKLTGQMLAEGIDPDDLRRGLAAWMGKGLHPSTLPSVVNEVMNAPPLRNGVGKPSTKAAAWLALPTEGA